MKTSLVGIISFLLCIIAEYYLGSHAICYTEHWTTFFYDGYYITDTYCTVGGLVKLVADFLTQFFITPWLGNIIIAALLSAIAMIYYQLLHDKNAYTTPLIISLTIPLSLVVLQCCTDWQLCGSIAILFAILCLVIRQKIVSYTTTFDALCCIALFLLAGPVATLYALCVAILDTRSNISSLRILIPFAIIALLGLGTMHRGSVDTWQRLLTPYGYYPHWADANATTLIPWIVIALTMLYTRLPFTFKQSKISLGISIGLSVCVCTLMITTCRDKSYALFKHFSCLARNAEWNEIIDACGGKPARNVLVQNCINEAWAELGLLGEHLFDNQQSNMNMLITGQIASGYVAAQVSDIYYSMGHIAQARRYALEANEHIGGLSPRLLQRLTQIAIIYGEYDEARKYLKYLSNTLFYHSWAEQHIALLDSNTLPANTFLAQKQRCLITNNSFCTSLTDELKCIVRNNPQNIASAQYLTAIMMFIGNETDFVPMVDEMRTIGALPTNLPRYFKQVYELTKRKNIEPCKQ